MTFFNRRDRILLHAHIISNEPKLAKLRWKSTTTLQSYRTVQKRTEIVYRNCLSHENAIELIVCIASIRQLLKGKWRRNVYACVCISVSIKSLTFLWFSDFHEFGIFFYIMRKFIYLLLHNLDTKFPSTKVWQNHIYHILFTAIRDIIGTNVPSWSNKWAGWVYSLQRLSKFRVIWVSRQESHPEYFPSLTS